MPENQLKRTDIFDEGDYALVVTSDNEVRLVTPRLDDDNDSPVPSLALLLIAVANKLQDSAWVEEIIADYFGDDRSE